MTPDNYKIEDTSNYYKTFNDDSISAIKKYIGLISEYLIQCNNNITLVDPSYYAYVIIKGLNMLDNIFHTLLLYTNNLDLTYYHCHKSLYYYIEFIGQIGSDKHSFLQLTSTDATLFLLKKTIYCIDSEYKKNATIHSCCSIKNIKLFTIIYIKLIINQLTNYDNSKNYVKNISNNLKSILQHILNLYLKTGTEEGFNSSLNIANVFLDTGLNNKADAHFDLFLKKLKKYNLSENDLQQKINMHNIAEKKNNVNPNKFITWIFNL